MGENQSFPFVRGGFRGKTSAVSALFVSGHCCLGAQTVSSHLCKLVSARKSESSVGCWAIISLRMACVTGAMLQKISHLC